MSEARVAFVTGGAGGIGSAICRSLARAGRRVAVADLSLEASRGLAQEIGGVGLELDVTNAGSVEDAFARCEGELGAVEVLVNCAGWDEFKPFLETDDAFTARVIEINLVGAMRVTRRALPGMIERGFGRIVNIASDAGRVGSSLEAVYSGAKGGLIAFTKTVARESARHGVTANSVCPGPTETPMIEGVVRAGGAGAKAISGMARAVPMRRLGRPEDVAPAVVFLASDEAGFVTGQTLSVSGGLTMA
jgi:2-hydroxycyclohexanecarboxyl-CoA dehydrogenase